jgi:hypothetical protein
MPIKIPLFEAQLGAKLVHFTKKCPSFKKNPILVRQKSKLKGDFFTSEGT